MPNKNTTIKEPEWISNLAYIVRRWWHLKVKRHPLMEVSKETLENFRRLDKASGFTAEEAPRLFAGANRKDKAINEQ